MAVRGRRSLCTIGKRVWSGVKFPARPSPDQSGQNCPTCMNALWGSGREARAPCVLPGRVPLQTGAAAASFSNRVSMCGFVFYPSWSGLSLLQMLPDRTAGIAPFPPDDKIAYFDEGQVVLWRENAYAPPEGIPYSVHCVVVRPKFHNCEVGLLCQWVLAVGASRLFPPAVFWAVLLRPSSRSCPAT